jgi:hypothetical protein
MFLPTLRRQRTKNLPRPMRIDLPPPPVVAPFSNPCLQTAMASPAILVLEITKHFQGRCHRLQSLQIGEVGVASADDQVDW